MNNRTNEATVSQSDPMTIDELIEEFEFLGDWDDQCDYLIDLGFDLPKLGEEDKTEQNRVHGCQSNVWLVADVKPAEPPIVEFVANSDAIIVNGLISVLMMLFNEKTPQEILATDVEGTFAKLGLDRHLSPQRRNGLFGMVERVRQIAAQAMAA
jgi:cysteine desulfuration protein SufE